jgi:copper(I)-binding protein
MAMPRLFSAFILILAMIAPGAAAEPVKVGSLELDGLWTRATPPRAPSAGGYLTIVNAGKDPDRLISAASPLAGRADFHEMAMKDGVMTMHPLAGIDIPAGGSVALEPNGIHIMFTELKGDLKQGGAMPVTFVFAKAGKVETTLQILAIGAKGPPPDAMGGMDMGGMKMDGDMKMDMGQ